MTTAVRAGDLVTYTDRAGVQCLGVATTEVLADPTGPTVYVLIGAHLRQLPATRLTMHGHRSALSAPGPATGQVAA